MKDLSAIEMESAFGLQPLAELAMTFADPVLLRSGEAALLLDELADLRLALADDLVVVGSAAETA